MGCCVPGTSSQFARTLETYFYGAILRWGEEEKAFRELSNCYAEVRTTLSEVMLVYTGVVLAQGAHLSTIMPIPATIVVPLWLPTGINLSPPQTTCSPH